jgi:DNA topoisomerase-2
MEFSEAKLTFLNFKEHAKTKGMWAGSQMNSEHNIYVRSGSMFEKKKIVFSPAMFKYYDEIMVNMLDQQVRSANAPVEYGGQVTEFDISFDEKTGIASFRNNGPGIPVEVRKDLGGKYSVEGVITKEFGGSNHDGNPDGVTGGINGVGMKIVVANSEYFEIETVDKKRKLYYKQICRNGMDIIEKPTIIDLSDTKIYKTMNTRDRVSHTTVSFKLDFKNVCRDVANVENPDWYCPENAAIISSLIEFRAYQLAIFLGVIRYRGVGEMADRIDYSEVKVIYNGKTIMPGKNLDSFAKMFGFVESVSTTIAHSKFPWAICFADTVSKIPDWEEMDPKELMDSLEEENMSVINGIHVSLKSNHLSPIINQLATELQPKAESAFKKTFTKDAFKKLLLRMLTIFDCRNVPVAQLFNSQSKDNIKLSTTLLKEWAKEYILEAKTVTSIWKMIEPKMSYMLLAKKETKTRKSKHIRKYTAAKFAGTKKSAMCSLCVPEGDSAAKPIEDILKSEKYGLGMDYYGMYNIQGVPPNALKETNTKVVGNKTVILSSVQLQKNISFQGLVDALNLNYEYTYYTGPDEKLQAKGDREFATLNYSSIIAAVDQDLDGIGQIFSLIIVFIARFWPHLMTRGFVKRFATPIIRVYESSGNVHEYFSQREFLSSPFYSKKEQVQTEEQGEDEQEEDEEQEDEEKTQGAQKRFKVKYYKGLATHSAAEVQHMGRTFMNNIFTYVWDSEAEHYMEVYFGKDADKRKDVLSHPVQIEYDVELYRKRQIKCSEHFRIEAHAQKLDFISRKLKHTLDGMIPVQRMAFAGARKAFKNSSVPRKVYQITGRVTTEMCYEHGDTSMNDTITKMAQNHTGACFMPLFSAVSAGFGDRREERGKAGSARYIETTLNYRLTNLLFPPEDDWLLQYEYKEGRQCEPKFYVGIVPYAILESLNTPAAGWSITTWSRDFKFVMTEIRNMIKYDYPKPAGQPCTMRGQYWKQEGMHMENYIYGSKKVTEVCVGSYEVVDDTHIIIKQLPPQVWSKAFVNNLIGIDNKTDSDTNKSGEKLEKDALVKSAQDMTCDDIVKIHIELVPGAMEIINKDYGSPYLDPVEDYFGLAKPLNANLNMLIEDGSVRSFENYEDIMGYWFEYRRRLYINRLDRQKLLLQYKIDYWENVYRFIDLDSKKAINIDKLSEEKRIAILEKTEFTKFNKSHLFTQSYVPTEALHDYVYVEAASYAYIDNITVGQKSKKSFESLGKKIADLKEEYNTLLSSTYKELWLKELAALEQVVELGLRTNWLYSTKQLTFVSSSSSKSSSSKSKKK